MPSPPLQLAAIRETERGCVNEFWILLARAYLRLLTQSRMYRTPRELAPRSDSSTIPEIPLDSARRLIAEGALADLEPRQKPSQGE